MVSKILTAISDDKSLVLFNAIALSSGENSDILISKLGLTKKQYYSRMSSLTNAGLISRSNGRHFLTSLGKVVYKAQLLIGKGKQNIWKLKAIDSIESSLQGSAIEERIKVVESVIQDDDLKEILFGSNKNKERHRLQQHFDDQLAVQPQSLSWSGKHKDNVMWQRWMTRFLDVHPMKGLDEDFLKMLQNSPPDEFGVKHLNILYNPEGGQMFLSARSTQFGSCSEKSWNTRNKMWVDHWGYDNGIKQSNFIQASKITRLYHFC